MRIKVNRKTLMKIVCILLALLFILFLPKLFRGMTKYLMRTELVSLQVVNFRMGEDEKALTIIFDDRWSRIIDHNDHVVKGRHYLKLYDGSDLFWTHGCFPNIDY